MSSENKKYRKTLIDQTATAHKNQDQGPNLIIDHPTVSDHDNEIRVGIDIVFQSTLPNVTLIRVKKAAHVPVL